MELWQGFIATHRIEQLSNSNELKKNIAFGGIQMRRLSNTTMANETLKKRSMV